MEMLFQPENSSTCGQHCVAMITGQSVEKVIKVFNSKGGTRTSQLIAALNYFGWTTGKQLEKLPGLPPELCIINIKWRGNKNYGHWAVVKNDWVYCPAYGKFRFSHKTWDMVGGSVVSYLRVNKK